MTGIGANIRRRIAVASVMACALSVGPGAAIHAQRSAASALTPRCASGDAKRDTLGRRALPGGYTITIGRVKDDVEYACVATLRSADGKVMFADSGFGAAVDAATGYDVDGDGTPELVLEMDTGGGNHCCWHYAVVSLKRPARLLFAFDWQGAPEFRRDANGRVTLWSWEGGFFGTDGSMASRLYAMRVYRFTSGKLVEETPQHCDEIHADTTRYQTPMPNADDIRRIAKYGVSADSSYGIATNIEMLVLQEVFCRRYDRGLEIARTTWPSATQSKFLSDFADMVTRSYKEYAEPLRSWLQPP